MDRASEQPLYRQLADHLRAQITSGALSVGDRIPSEVETMEAHDVGRNTVREAVRVLTLEGLVRTEQGKGTFVADPRAAPMPFRANIVHRRDRRRETRLGAFQAELAELGREGHIDVSVERRPAPEDMAARLGIETGEKVVVRRRVQVVEGMPSALADSWFPAALVEGTAITQPELVAGGTNRLMEELGHAAIRRRDEITARMPTPKEAQALQIAGGVPVLLVVSTELEAADQPTEVYTLTMPADRHVLVYELEQ
jgi:GntR family transcriptional regulator